MEYYIAVFWSRTDAFSFANSLKLSGIPSAMIPTPREAGRTCGLSVKIMAEYFQQAQSILQRSRNSSFGGWFLEMINNGRRIIIKQ